MSQVYRERKDPVIRQLNGHGNRRFEVTFPDDPAWLQAANAAARRKELHDSLDVYLDRYLKETA